MAGDALVELFAELGVKVSEREWSAAEARLKRLDQLSAARSRGATANTTRVVSQAIREQERAAQREATLQQRATTRATVLRERTQARNTAAAQREATRRYGIEQQQRARAIAVAKRQHEAGFAKATKEAQKSSAAMSGAFGGVAAAITMAAVQIGASLATSAGHALISFNANLEDSKNQIAGMLALTKKTHLSEELASADMLVANLQRRAATLPGTTAEYVSMLSNITRPIMDAKMSMQDLEDITVNSVVAAKAFGIDAGVAARDIDQALRGIYHSVDPFSGKVLGSIGYKGEEGRSRYNALSEKKRAEEFKRALTQTQITELGAAQGQTFRGLWSTIEDTLAQTFGKIGAPLFNELKTTFQELIAWINKNQDGIDKLAETIGGALAAAFRTVKELALKAYDIFSRHREVIGKIASIIGDVLVSALKVFEGALKSAFDQLDKVFSFLETRTGKWLLDVAAGSNSISNLITLMDKLGISMEDAFNKIAESSGLHMIMKAIEFFENPGSGPAAPGEDERVRARIGDKDNYVPPEVAALPIASVETPRGSFSIGSITVGDINIDSPNANPTEVAKEAKRVFSEELAGVLRRTKDEVA